MQTTLDVERSVRRIPVEIAFREVLPSPAAERELHRKLRWLARSFPEVTSCRVLVEPGGSGDERGPYHLRMEMTVPGGHLGIEGRPPAGAGRHELFSWIREAFERARRELALRRPHPAVRPPGRLF
jgi:hypothetical protein